MDGRYIQPIVYSHEFIDIFNTNKSGAKYHYSKIKKAFNLKRGQYITIYHLRDYLGIDLKDIIDMIERIRRKKDKSST